MVHELVVFGICATREEPMANEAAVVAGRSRATHRRRGRSATARSRDLIYDARIIPRDRANADSIESRFAALCSGGSHGNRYGESGRAHGARNRWNHVAPRDTGFRSCRARRANEVGDRRSGRIWAKEAARKLHEEDSTAAEPVAPGEGELRIVDKAFYRQSAVLVSGNRAALTLLSDHFPNLWETGKQNLSLEEIRYDLHRFFSLRSSAGQATVALYRLVQVDGGNRRPCSRCRGEGLRRHRRRRIKGHCRETSARQTQHSGKS